MFLKILRVSGTRFLIKQFVIKKHVSNYSTKFDQTIVRLYIFFWNTFSEPKKTKDTKEAVIEYKNLEKTIEESNLNDVGLWPSEISELPHEYSLRNGSEQRQSYNSNFKNSAVMKKIGQAFFIEGTSRLVLALLFWKPGKVVFANCCQS